MMFQTSCPGGAIQGWAYEGITGLPACAVKAFVDTPSYPMETHSTSWFANLTSTTAL